MQERFLLCLSLIVCSLSIMSFSVKSAELIMLEQEGCAWCERWHEEVGDVYHKTAEGKIAPLVLVDIHEPKPYQYSLLKYSSFTPAFVVWHEGEEIGRIRGYPGEDFFWPLLAEILHKLPEDVRQGYHYNFDEK